jgi:hypothetical protein
MDVVKHDFGLKPLRVVQHSVHEIGTLQPFSISGPVVHVGGGGQLATLLQSRYHQRFEVGASRVYGSGVSGWPGTENEKAAVLYIAHV